MFNIKKNGAVDMRFLKSRFFCSFDPAAVIMKIYEYFTENALTVLWLIFRFELSYTNMLASTCIERPMYWLWLWFPVLPQSGIQQGCFIHMVEQEKHWHIMYRLSDGYDLASISLLWPDQIMNMTWSKLVVINQYWQQIDASDSGTSILYDWLVRVSGLPSQLAQFLQWLFW